MALGFKLPVDIANRALQHLGARRIASFTEATKNASEATLAYDKARRSELRKSVWNFATRRSSMRPVDTSTLILTPGAWSSVTTYAPAAGVSDTNGNLWISRQASNLNHSPEETATPYWTGYTGPIIVRAWDATFTYLPGELATSGGVTYIALNQLGNLNKTPASNPSYWSSFTASYTTNQCFLPYPIGYSPDAAAQRTLFYLPYGFIRMAPQDPQNPSTSRLGVSAEMRYRDWEIENGFIMTQAQTTPFVLRYVADVTDVRVMDDLFCEAMAARIAMDLAEMLTQSKEKEQKAQAVYGNFMRIAKDINAIEMGSTDNEENPDEPQEFPVQQAQGGVPAQKGQ